MSPGTYLPFCAAITCRLGTALRLKGSEGLQGLSNSMYTQSYIHSTAFSGVLRHVIQNVQGMHCSTIIVLEQGS